MADNVYDAVVDGKPLVDHLSAAYTANRENGLSNEDNIASLLETFAANLGDKNARSVRSKLVREGVFVKDAPKPKAKREEGPSKKELARTLRDLTGRDLDGIDGATKGAISELIEVLSEAGGESEAVNG